jgi:FtsP/CotA-like multicopper oxidase with cupredoxin domain
MKKLNIILLCCMLSVAAAFPWGINQAGAQVVIPPGAAGFNPNVDYTKPNFAYSPNIRKFVDSLPGLGAAGCVLGNPLGTGTCNENNLGQYIPIAVPDTTTYPDADFYVIGGVQYSKKLHSDLPPTTIRGYRQENATDPMIQNVQQYLGPAIIARTYDPTKPDGVNGNGRAVRVLFKNEMPTGPAGHLFLPVDPSIMGSGPGPFPGLNFTQNRVTIPHLHGGATPWISDGTPHQWLTPANEPLVASQPLYQKGASFVNVPDMVGAGKSIPAPASNDGMGTLFWTNQQSQRLMFYHDHAWGITRLNVYAGMAAPYLLTDQAEDDMIDGTNVTGAFTTPKQVLPNLGGVYKYGIPLVIQDRAFVNDATTPPGPGFTGIPTDYTATTDPLWYNAGQTWVGGTGVIPAGGNFWYPHEYMPNENIYATGGALDMGRWDYGPWLNPPAAVIYPNLPSPSTTPEFFADTMLVNGTAFPYLNVPPTAVRFRILSVGNDRSLNLSWFLADPAHPTEVKMVPAAPNATYPTWPSDGRNGGVPDPTTVGPPWLQIGNEGGILPQVAVIPPHPVVFEQSRLLPTILGISVKSLYLMPAERADVIVDFSAYPGQTLILYNDAPAPSPLFDERYQLFTAAPDFRATGGAPPSSIGFGPNTRTVMQVRVANTTPSPAFDLASLQAALPQAYKATQAPPIVPQAAYNTAFGTANGNTYVSNTDATVNLSGTAQSVSNIVTTLGGSGYTTPPSVFFVSANGVGSGAAATATLNGVTAITVTAGGTGYTLPPVIAITRAAGDTTGTGATAVSSISGGQVTAITMVNLGSNYTLNPTVTITRAVGDTTGTGATATSGITLGAVAQVNITAGGSGYTKAPFVYFAGGGGSGATADAMLTGDTVIDTKNITEGFERWYGRLNILLGTTPVPLNPTAPAPAVPGIAAYIDPPSDYWYDGKIQVFRLSHLGVDNHIAHFHLANLQVVNRVDFTNTLMVPDANEVGWKESIRTEPFTDLILAVKPKSPVLPFAIPRSSRLLDPTTLAGSTANYVQPAPVPGLPNPAGISNVVTDYNWEYVWHCHLLAHEENDMMRPIIFNPILMTPPVAPNPPLLPTPQPHFVGVLNAGAYKNPAVTWTRGNVINPVSGATYQYRWSTNNGVTTTVQRAYGVSNWPMPANLLTAGSYTLICDARRSTALPTDPPDATGTLDFFIIPPLATGVTLTPSIASPHAYPVTFTAAGTGSANYLYRFKVDGVVARDYSTTATFTLPISTPPGSHSVTVDVRTSPLSTTPDVTSAPVVYSVLTANEVMYAGFNSGLSGTYQWDGSSLTSINAGQPTVMATGGSALYASFGGIGVWKWELAQWTQIHTLPVANMAASGSTVYATFTGSGLWQSSGGAWSPVHAVDPVSIAASGSTLYVNFAAFGLWTWNGATWTQLHSLSPANMAVSGSTLYADFTGSGIWKWNGSAWSQVHTLDPTSMTASGSALYATFTGAGLWKWDGVTWTQLHSLSPANMAATGLALYADFAGSGIWKWNGATWTQVTPADPTVMVGF